MMASADEGGAEVRAGRIGAVLIAGPTASGKSALAIGLAKALGGAVVNADSMQVYRDLRIITARPTPEEEAAHPHLLYGHVDGAVNFSVGRYMADAARILARGPSGGVPIFVGGTGLYFKALTQGLSPIPAVPQAVRDRVREASEGVETPALHRRLAEADPQTARSLRPSDRLRVLRALEVLEATGRPLLSYHGERQPGPLSGVPVLKVFLEPDREELRLRIDARFGDMMGAGALDEVRALAERGLDPALPVMRAHGVPGLLSHLRGEIGLEEAVARARNDTRRYAKRQFTFFRHQLADWIWAAPGEAYEVVMRGLSVPLVR
jgi:tRNA dimethylallyltransferase